MDRWLGGSDAGWARKALAHGLIQGGMQKATGGEFRHGFYAGIVVGALEGKVAELAEGSDELGVAMSAVLGGTASALGGGKFANGAISGAFSYMFNQASSKGWGNDPDGKYTVENFGDLEGKKIVGVAILDEYLAGQATATDKGGIGHSGLTVISKKVKDLNVKLAINGEAVALVVVRTFNGYKQFMIDHASMVGNVRYAALFTHAAPGSTFSNPIHQFKFWSRGKATFDPQGPISWDSIMASSSIQTQYMNSFTCGEKLLDASGLFDATFRKNSNYAFFYFDSNNVFSHRGNSSGPG